MNFGVGIVGVVDRIGVFCWIVVGVVVIGLVFVLVAWLVADRVVALVVANMIVLALLCPCYRMCRCR